MEDKLIAPCGMNCGVCINYLSMKNEINKKGFRKTYCPGCLPRGENCTYMKKNCVLIGEGILRFCTECKEYPCNRLKALDKRYRMKYHMSMIDNLEYRKEYGMERLLEREEAKWLCPECGEVICCHNGLCLSCSLDTLREKKTYRWGED